MGCRTGETLELPAGYRLTVEREPSLEDRRTLSGVLGAFNEPFLPQADPQSLAVLVRDLGRYLWVHSELRRNGVGCRLMAEAERQAHVLGCHSAWVDTFTFQAPEFYAKLGYREFGRLDYPPAHQRIFLQKRLVQP